MTGRRDWLININSLMNNKVKFSNDNTLSVIGIGDVLIIRKDGGQSMISNILYIPVMKSNLLSIGQLIENNYKVVVEYKMLGLLD